jgi:molecular chaperone Hsp33
MSTKIASTGKGLSPTDDIVIGFQTITSGVNGRIVRLGPAVNEILTRHDYPEAVSQVLGEALALTAMLGSQLKFAGKLTLQTNTDGPLGFLVVNFENGGTFRGYASFDAERLTTLAANGKLKEADLLGKGHLAMTIDPGVDMERYQGIVAIDNGTLSDAALEYFRQSEQLPTFIKLSVARHFAAGVWQWRAGGLMVQHLTAEGGEQSPEPIPTKDDGTDSGWVLGVDDENWRRVEILASTVQDHELLDPTLTPERLLYRLFHEEGVSTSTPQPIAMNCGCSRDHVGMFLKNFGAAELTDMRDPDGTVTVTCEFCTTPYKFTDEDLG